MSYAEAFILVVEGAATACMTVERRDGEQRLGHRQAKGGMRMGLGSLSVRAGGTPDGENENATVSSRDSDPSLRRIYHPQYFNSSPCTRCRPRAWRRRARRSGWQQQQQQWPAHRGGAQVSVLYPPPTRDADGAATCASLAEQPRGGGPWVAAEQGCSGLVAARGLTHLEGAGSACGHQRMRHSALRPASLGAGGCHAAALCNGERHIGRGKEK
eukprot:364418-Chlamydomonas_euryale.AAC.11